MTVEHIILLFVAALAGGMLNSVAGGGSFLTFPALIVSGIAPIQANATSTVALWPGAAASVGAYRRELGKANRRLVMMLTICSAIGGIAGAELLLHTPAKTFVRLIPFLLLLATLLFAFGKPLTAWWKRSHPSAAVLSNRSLAGMVGAQLIIALYGGYFGGGIGILMLATLGLMGMDQIHEMNAVKTLLAAAINGVAVVTFVLAGAVDWGPALVMIAGSLIGGYGGAAYARRLDPGLVRIFVIAVGVLMTVYFFLRSS
ncbi:MAG: sulfite exporter TauE/SafE family protein [Chloroflexota bacterium]